MHQVFQEISKSIKKPKGVFSSKVNFANNLVLVEEDTGKSAIGLQKVVQAVEFDSLIRVENPSNYFTQEKVFCLPQF